MFCVYIIYSSGFDRYYVGQTDDIQHRLERHNNGLVRSTKHYKPWVLKYYEQYSTRGEAMRREKEIKSYKSRKYLEALIKQVQSAESRERHSRQVI